MVLKGGLGYCFSASLPPLLATAASEGLKIINEQPERVARVQRFAVAVHRGLEAAFEGSNFEVQGVELSPMKHIVYNGDDAEKKLDALVDRNCFSNMQENSKVTKRFMKGSKIEEERAKK
ncbi:hypothetical protein ANCCEY_14836, partial [Ancylostoma ceylanicum]